ncbi:MAG: hypothetical protein QOH63_204 [Acidobacteriota bacterium]|jgi:PAS domain S-box-containing protein|nr:hypothetical protein [Acidobacteriota bacterium]
METEVVLEDIFGDAPYRKLVEAIRDFAVLHLDRDGRIVSWNAGATALFGYSEAEIIGKPYASIFTTEDQQSGVPERELKEVAETGRAEDTRWHPRRDGTRFYANCVITALLDENGSLCGFAKVARDDTTRKDAESELQAIQERYRLLAEVMPQLVWSTDENGSHFYYNRRWYEYTGLSEEESLGFGFANALHPDDKERTLKRWKQAWQNGEGYVIEYRFYSRPLNEYRWFLGRAMPVRDASGKIIQWVGTCTDIDEQKRAEEKIKKSETSLANAQRIAHIGNWEQDFITDELRWSDEIFRIFGVEPQQFPATSEDFFRHVHPEDVESVKQSVAHAIQNHTFYEIDHRVIRPDSSVRWVHEYAEIYRDSNGRAVSMIGTVQDITERKAAEESIRFQAHLLDAVEQSVIATDLDGIVIYWNQFAQHLYGWTAQEAIGRQIVGLTTPEVMTEQALEIMSQLRQGESWAGEFNVQRRDGTTFPVQIINSPINDDRGTLIGIIGVSVDITERKRQEASLIELTSQLERQSNVFNTTLSSITDFAYIFDRDGRFIYANQPLLDLWGLKLDEAVGKNFFDLQYPDDLALRLQQQIQQVIDTRQGIRDETPYTSPAGVEGFYEYIFTPVFAADGTVEVVAGSTRDYTERKHIEILLDTQKQALEMVVGGSPLAEVLEYLTGIVEHQSVSSIASILLLDDEGRLHNGASPSLPEDYIQAIEGIKADENVGTCSAAAATSKTIISPDIAADPKWQDLKHLPLGLGLQAAWSLPIIAADKRVLGTFGTYFREKREPTKLERQRVEILAKTAALAIERKQAEEALRDAHERITNIFESITDCFYALDADWRFTYINPQAELYFNRPKETMMGRAYMEAFPLTRNSEALAKLQAAMSEQKPVHFETLSPTTGKWIDLHVFPADGGLGIYFRDITERKRAEEELKKINEQLEGRVAERTAALSETNEVLQEEVRERRRIEAERVELLRRVIFAQEDERRRIAREMHDQFGQGLSALTLKLAVLKEESGEQVKLREQLETLEAVANQLDTDVDFLVWELRPTVLDDLGLPAALKAHVQNWSKHFNIPAELHMSSNKQERLTGEIETVLYRITQEALNNIAKHAQAGKVDIILEHRNRHVSLIIEDDGVGFDGAQAFGPNNKGLGLIGMRERAALVGGTAEIESHPKDGTTVFIRIPVPLKGVQGG